MAEQPPTAMPSTQEQNESPTYGTGLWISYKKDIRTRLRSSLLSVARFFRIMSSPSHDLFEEFRDLKADFSTVKSYYNFLSSFYKSPETWSLDRRRWMVTTISTYKSTGFFEHEYLVAEAQCEGEKVYLRIERRRSKSLASKASDDSDPSSTEDDLPTGGGSSGSSSKTAHDTIRFAKALKSIVNSKECVEVIEFSKGKGLSLSQITVLALCVNSMGRVYSLLKANCYWFAHLVVKAAKLIEPDCKEELISKKRPGEWLNLLPLAKSDTDVIREVKAAYDNLFFKFNDDIEKSVNNESSPIYLKKRAEAERLAAEKEEERRKREEAEDKREEAERLEQEERRKREEAEEEIKRLRAQLAAAQAASSSS